MKLMLLVVALLLIYAAYTDSVGEMVDTAKEAYDQPGASRTLLATLSLAVASEYDKRMEVVASPIIGLLALAMLLRQSEESNT